MKHNQIAVNGDKIVNVNVAVLFFKLPKQDTVFAECPSLGITTYGNTLTEAKKMFEEAFSLWLETVNEECSIHQVLKELGWKLTSRQAKPAPVDYSKVPLHLLDITTKEILIPAGV